MQLDLRECFSVILYADGFNTCFYSTFIRISCEPHYSAQSIHTRFTACVQQWLLCMGTVRLVQFTNTIPGHPYHDFMPPLRASVFRSVHQDFVLGALVDEVLLMPEHAFYTQIHGF